jgi:iron complex outermembrane recepter protein
MSKRVGTFIGLSAAILATAPQALAGPVADDTGPPGSDVIMVTARQRPEDVQTVPAAVSVVDQILLQRSYTVNTQQLSTLVPALNYSSANPRNTAFTIRGLGSSVVAVSQANDGLEPGVGFYVDQVYHARPATAAFDFTDLEQIEVLRGPQGTLFGKNTTAGAINVTSKAPSFKPEANGELSFGSRLLMQMKASVSGPLINDMLAYRISGLMTRQDGSIHNARTGQDYNGIGNKALRGQLLLTPGADFRLRLIGDFSSFDNACCAQVYLRTGTSLRPAARQYQALATGQNYSPPSLDAYDRVTDIDADLGVNTNEGGVSAIANYNLGRATLTSVSAWRFWNWDAANDRDYTGLPIQLYQHIPSRQDQVSQELRIASNGDQALTYVGGLYFFRQVITGRPISVYGPLAAYWLIGPSTGNTVVPGNLLNGYGQDGSTRFESNSYAAFGEVNWHIVPRLTLTGGLRYTHEDKNGSYTTTVSGGLATSNAALLAAQLSVLRPQAYTASNSDGSLSGRANISWQATDKIMAYASFARGFKSGGINMSGLPLNAQNQPVLSTAVIRPERNTTYEFGIKSEFLDRAITFNLTGYWTDVKDFQATIVDSAQTVALRGYLSNIPLVRVRGIEADSLVRIGSHFNLRAALAFADGKYADYPAGPCPLELQGTATTACNLTGQRLAGLPRWSETLGGDYRFPTSAGAVILHADSSWRSAYNGDSSLSRATMISAYNLTNASLGYQSDKGWEVAVFARNLLGANFIQNLTIQAGNSGLILATPSDPRTVGITVRVHR